jgi:hypothetical protein
LVCVAGLLCFAGCSLITDSFLSNEFSGDPFPVNVDVSSGAIVVGMQPQGQDPVPAILDLLSPITESDPGNGITPSIDELDLELLGARDPLTAASPPVAIADLVPRARFPQAELVSIHPCDTGDANVDGNCHIGDHGQVIYKSVFGADSLAGDAVRLDLANRQLFVLPDVGGSDRQRTLDCDAVFDAPYQGGGTLEIAGTELAFGNRRIALAACLGPHPEMSPQSKRGTDALLVVSTSIGTSILGATAYARYQATYNLIYGVDPPLDQGDHTAYLPSGIVHGQLGMLESLSLVAISASNDIGPCRQIYAHRALAPHSLGGSCDRATNGDCPCEDDSTFCAVPAIFELTPPGGIPVLVVPDDDPTLQALRTELRPVEPEVDGILGTQALSTAQYDIDYPHDRMLARCTGANCCARPFLQYDSDRDQINRCLATQGCPVAPIIPVSVPTTPP